MVKPRIRKKYEPPRSREVFDVDRDMPWVRRWREEENADKEGAFREESDDRSLLEQLGMQYRTEDVAVGPMTNEDAGHGSAVRRSDDDGGPR